MTLVNRVGYVSGPLKCVGSGCNMGELGGVFKWAIKMGEILVAIFINQVGFWVWYLSGPLK